VKLSYLVRGGPGHPLHPPLSAVTIGAYTAAVIAAIVHVAGTGSAEMARTAGFLIQVGLISTLPVAITGLVDWFALPRGTPTWKTGRAHLIVLVVATVLFRVAWGLNEHALHKGSIPTTNFALMLIAYVVLGVGSWLGGKIVFVFGYRVLPAEAAAPATPRVR
jgi:uncharacterized membrane protein